VETFIEGTAAGLADVRAQLAAAGTPALLDAMNRGGAEGKSLESSSSNSGRSPGNCVPRPSQC
jgi:hypothetical protein